MLVRIKSARVFPVLAPHRPLLYAEQCPGLYREVPRGSHVGPVTSISRQQTQVGRERKRLEGCNSAGTKKELFFPRSRSVKEECLEQEEKWAGEG